MSRTHSKADVYVGDELTWTDAIVVEQPSISKLLVKARSDHPSAYRNVLVLSDVEFVGTSSGAWRWSGTNDEGERVTVTRVPRAGGCRSCGR
jgi:hypothetical protein